MDSSHFNLKNDQKGRYILVNYWASWCGPCRSEIPKLNKIAKDLKDYPFTIVGVLMFDGSNEDEATLNVKNFTKKIPIDYPIYFDLDGTRIGDSFGVHEFPESYLIDPDGKIVDVVIGEFFDYEVNRVENIVKNGAKK